MMPPTITADELVKCIKNNFRYVIAVDIVVRQADILELQIKLAWWLWFGLGLFHYLTRKRIEGLISNTIPYLDWKVIVH